LGARRSSNLASPPAETNARVKEADRERYAREVALLESRLAGAIPAGGSEFDDSAVWDVYSGVEKLVAVLRFRLDYETPGVFTKLPKADRPAPLLEEARALLALSGEQISGGMLVEAVETLRKARNNLRGCLTSKRKAASSQGKTGRSDSAT
jgi:hypothetical protein